MRKLTLNEKISLKGIFKHKGRAGHLNALNMQEAVFIWGLMFGRSILYWYKLQFKGYTQ
jgi:hypothetical protein